MGFPDRQQRRRERDRRERQELRETKQKAEILEDLLELVEREYEEEVEVTTLDEDGEETTETRTVTRTEHTAPRLQMVEETLGVDVTGAEAVNRGKISDTTLSDLQDAYDNDDPMATLRYLIEVVTGTDPETESLIDEDENSDEDGELTTD